MNTGYGGTPSQDSPEESPMIGSNFTAVRESTENSQVGEPRGGCGSVRGINRFVNGFLPRQATRESQKPDEEKKSHSVESIDTILKNSREDNHLAQWVRNSHQIPPPDHEEAPIEEWTPEELAARAPKESVDQGDREQSTRAEEIVAEIGNSDVEQQSTASSASLSTVKSNSMMNRKNGSLASSKENSSSSINICRRCHR